MKNLRNKLGTIDMFINDSNHSNLNLQLAENQIALDWLESGGILVSDDVQNDAFLKASDKFGWPLTVIKHAEPV